jgi:predicted O-methyltransferase YrrM
MQNLIPPYLRKLKLSSQSRDIPNISEENAVFLTTLIASKKPKNILEIGTAN